MKDKDCNHREITLERWELAAREKPATTEQARKKQVIQQKSLGLSQVEPWAAGMTLEGLWRPTCSSMVSAVVPDSRVVVLSWEYGPQGPRVHGPTKLRMSLGPRLSLDIWADNIKGASASLQVRTSRSGGVDCDGMVYRCIASDFWFV